MSDLLLTSERLKTFKKWPISEPNQCTKEKMASAGFYFTGSKKEPDLATCYFCLKELDGWEEEDNPWEEHKKHAGYCKFIQLNKTDSEITLEDMHKLEQYRQTRRCKKLLDKVREQFKKEVDETADKIRIIM